MKARKVNGARRPTPHRLYVEEVDVLSQAGQVVKQFGGGVVIHVNRPVIGSATHQGNPKFGRVLAWQWVAAI